MLTGESNVCACARAPGRRPMRASNTCAERRVPLVQTIPAGGFMTSVEH